MAMMLNRRLRRGDIVMLDGRIIDKAGGDRRRVPGIILDFNDYYYDIKWFYGTPLVPLYWLPEQGVPRRYLRVYGIN